MRLLWCFQLGLSAEEQPSIGRRDTHALLAQEPDEVDPNFSTIACTVDSNRPTGLVESYTDPPKLCRTRRLVSSSDRRACGRDRANRSSLATDGLLVDRVLISDSLRRVVHCLTGRRWLGGANRRLRRSGW